jgi:hypothetical protein
MDRSALVKQRAEELAMQLLENDLTTDDPDLQGACEKLRPFKAKLNKVDRDLIRKGLDMVTPDPLLVFDAAAKKCLNDLVEKLWGMRFMFGVL